MTRDELVFVDVTPANLVAARRGAFATLTGRTLREGQPETGLLDTAAFRETLVREQLNELARQNLVAFATAPYLDFLGQFVGVERLAAAGAATLLTFMGNGGNAAPVLIASGTRVASDDGQFVFETVADVLLPAGAASVNVVAVCQTTGAGGNGVNLTIMLDPYQYVTGFTATTPSDGADDESDDELRARILIAPDSFSVAGPTNAYKYFAKTASPSILDVAVVTARPGTVKLVVLVSGGVAQAATLAAVEAACNPDDVRPLCDTVTTGNPAIRSYGVALALTVYTGKSGANARAAALAAVNAYVNERTLLLGRDVVREQLISRVMAASPDIYSCTLTAPAATLAVGVDEVAICTGGVAVTIAGYNNG